ncbi:hypothetical protein AWB78_07723 [Caballeronia calidae]|uniref:Uncharacterized protein n=1 Tax=Caballeronia calidae TaxID=1777139 RepID=A0A158EHD5_9BURK|nr:hypothetical protein [Caballeronia calidae]SAL05826.1 hypothetical protein AWB78_07723 [Caballeronia calidae]
MSISRLGSSGNGWSAIDSLDQSITKQTVLRRQIRQRNLNRYWSTKKFQANIHPDRKLDIKDIRRITLEVMGRRLWPLTEAEASEQSQESYFLGRGGRRSKFKLRVDSDEKQDQSGFRGEAEAQDSGSLGEGDYPARQGQSRDTGAGTSMAASLEMDRLRNQGAGLNADEWKRVATSRLLQIDAREWSEAPDGRGQSSAKPRSPTASEGLVTFQRECMMFIEEARKAGVEFENVSMPEIIALVREHSTTRAPYRGESTSRISIFVPLVLHNVLNHHLVGHRDLSVADARLRAVESALHEASRLKASRANE